MDKKEQHFLDFVSLSQDIFCFVLEETITSIEATFITIMEDPILLYRNYYQHQVFTSPSSLGGLLCPTTTTTTNNSFQSKSNDNARALTKRKRSFNDNKKKNSNDNKSFIVTVQIPRCLLLKDSRRSDRSYYYNWNESTEYNYSVGGVGTSSCATSTGKYKHIRDRLDYSYHKMYSQSRQLLQDRIIDSVLSITTTSVSTSSSVSSPWIIFTAGVMGAGKTHSIRRLREEGKLTFLHTNNENDKQLPQLLTVDPDCIRHLLPEFDVYVKRCPEKAGTYTQKEAGLIAEIATKVALSKGHNVVVDGSLRNSEWYINYFQHLRQQHSTMNKENMLLRIAIIHVTAPFPTILKRTKQRAKETGRVVPIELLKRSIEEVPMSVDILKSHVDYFLQVHNP